MERSRNAKGGLVGMKAVVFTLGCKVNECESDSLIAGLSALGYEVSDRLEKADLYIINTCAVTSEAEKKSRQTASRVLKLNPNAQIIYTGCASQKAPESFLNKPNVKLVSGSFSKDKILSALNESGIMLASEPTEYEELNVVKTLKKRTYVKVQDGCNNFCSYCIIPYLRGRNRSRNPEKVVEEINLVKPSEAVINGINLSAYNYNGLGLKDLIKRLSSVDCRIRLGSLEVRVITEEFLTALKGLKDFAPHFHLSLQSGSNAVLKDMNRHYTREEFIEKVKLIRKHFAFAGITTDIIVGYPTESESDFEQSLSLAKECEFSDIHPFIFSAREGTKAYKLKELPSSVKKARMEKMLALKGELKQSFLEKSLGSTLKVLIEEKVGEYYQGYSENYLRVYLKQTPKTDMVKVKVASVYEDGVLAEIIE